MLYQPKIFWHFFGGGRGEFEYEFLVSESNKSIRNTLVELYGFRVGIEKYYLDDAAEIRIEFDKTINQTKIEDEPTETDKQKFFLLLREARYALKNESPEEMIEKLKVALSLRPTNLVTNFMHAQAYEILGDSNMAIDTYKSAISIVEEQSINLKNFVETQIIRVQEKGPMKRLPNPGLKYLPF